MNASERFDWIPGSIRYPTRNYRSIDATSACGCRWFIITMERQSQIAVSNQSPEISCKWGVNKTHSQASSIPRPTGAPSEFGDAVDASVASNAISFNVNLRLDHCYVTKPIRFNAVFLESAPKF